MSKKRGPYYTAKQRALEAEMDQHLQQFGKGLHGQSLMDALRSE